MRRTLAALILVIAPLLQAAPALPAHAQAVPGTLLSISPTSDFFSDTIGVSFPFVLLLPGLRRFGLDFRLCRAFEHRRSDEA